MPANHPADEAQITCLKCVTEQTASEWSRMLWTMAFLPVPELAEEN